MFGLDLSSKNTEILVALITGATIKTAVFWLLRNRHEKKYVGRVSDICIYPIKSAGRLGNVTSAELTNFGLATNGVKDR